ncbi:MAG: S1 RNA-binding domain-containing protein, partial [Candidatus Eremiobacteraeota bacterium]|nr:S1 RNA-binding domain-containing protein [Candidatus Eremiobacteraeota bacterium]
FIIDKLAETIAEPRKELSMFAPRMIVIKINPEKIKDVIGPGGKIINKIIQETGIEKMDIEDDGTVFITSLDGESGEKAKTMVENITKDIVVGETYTGIVTRVIAIGAFVQILPGKEGLVHISQLAPQRVEKVEDVVKVGDEIQVKVMEVDSQGRVNLSRKALLAGGNDGGRGDSGRGGGGNGEFRPRPRETQPAPDREETTPAPGGDGAPPMRRRRRPTGRRED